MCYCICSASSLLGVGGGVGAHHLVCSALSTRRLYPPRSSVIPSRSWLFPSALSRSLLTLSLHLNFGFPLLILSSSVTIYKELYPCYVCYLQVY